MEYHIGTEITGPARVILKLLFQNRQLTRKQLSETTGLSTLTIAKTIKIMIENGVIFESATIDSEKGRKPSLLTINPDYGYVIGIDVGANSMKIGVVGFDGTLFEKRLIKPEEPALSPVTYLSIEKLQEYIESLIQKYSDCRLLGIGFGISGLVDYDTQTIKFCPNIIGYNKLNISQLLGEYFHVPVIVDTSARCMAIGERFFGKIENSRDLSFISVGSSVAVGTIIDDKMFRGGRGFAGELGHVKVETNSSFTCTCGSNGCAEGFVTLPMIFLYLRKSLHDYRGYSTLKDRFEANGTVSYQEMADAYLSGDKLVMEVLGRAVEHLATMIANYINLFNPTVLVLGGGFFDVFSFLCPEIERSVQQKGLTPSLQDLTIYCSEMAENGVIIGSAMQIIEKYFS